MSVARRRILSLLCFFALLNFQPTRASTGTFLGGLFCNVVGLYLDLVGAANLVLGCIDLKDARGYKEELEITLEHFDRERDTVEAAVLKRLVKKERFSGENCIITGAAYIAAGILSHTLGLWLISSKKKEKKLRDVVPQKGE